MTYRIAGEAWFARRALAVVVSLAVAVAGALVWPGPVVEAAPPSVVWPAFSDISGHPAEFEFSVLGALGVFGGSRGPGGTVRPNDPITRVEFCKVLITATGRTEMAQRLAGLIPDYADAESIPTWGWGYVNSAWALGIVGLDPYGDGTFRPGRYVTHAEAVTMVVRALPGHDPRVPQVGQFWPGNYLAYGQDYGLTLPVSTFGPFLPCARCDMAKMLYAAMQVNYLDRSGQEIPGTASLDDRIWSGTLLSYVTGDSVNTVTIDLDGNGTADPGETKDLAATLVLGSPGVLRAMVGRRVVAVGALGGPDKPVVFIGPAPGAP